MDDPNYWINRAAAWIQNKSAESPMFFPANFPMGFPQAPEPPRISNHDATINDNHTEADMELDDDVKDEEPVTENWVNWQASQAPSSIPNTVLLQTPPAQLITSNQPSEKLSAELKSINNRSEPYTSRFSRAPSAPGINQTHETTQSVDMVIDDSEEEDDSNSAIMEAQKRKKLPVWIREGLERLEREKKQEAMRLQREKEIQEEEKNRKKVMEEALKELERENVAKSKYDSDYENDDQLRDETPETVQNPGNQPTDPQNDEDAFEEMMLLVRKTLTEVFLEVTHERIQEISSETLSKYRKKASSVTSNRTVTNSLGLGVYSNSSDDESETEEIDKNDHSDWEPDAVLKERIRVKTIAFEYRAKEIREKLASIAEVEQGKKEQTNVDSGKSRFDSDDDEPQKPKGRNIDGEEKYEQIYSSSYASVGRHKKKTRFNDPKDRTTSVLVTHVGMLDAPKPTSDNGLNAFLLQPTPLDDKKKKRETSSGTTSTSSSERHKKHKKHKKSSKHSKKSSKKRDRSRSRDNESDRRKSYKSDRRSIESRSSVRSSDSRRHRSRSRSRSRDRRQRSRRY